MDADLSDRCLNYYKKLLNIDNEEYIIIINDYKYYADYTINYMVFNTWLRQIEDKLNGRLVIAMASNNKAKDVHLYL